MRSFPLDAADQLPQSETLLRTIHQPPQIVQTTNYSIGLWFTRREKNNGLYEKGIGMEFLALIATITSICCCFIVSFIVNWKLTMVIYDKELAPTRSGGIRQGALFGVFIGWLSLITFIVCATDFISGSFLMTKKNQSTFTISDILIVASIFSQSIGLISFVGSFVQGLSEARGAAVSVFRLIDEEKDESINEAEVWEDITESRSNINGDIKFNNVNFHYPSRRDAPVLCNLSVVARAGQTTALVGFSGCGKSTCISLFLRYYEPSSGEITIDGKPITNYNVQHLRENIGVVSQEPGYETKVGIKGSFLSGGEKQRIAIARVLIRRPKVLLLDEATSAMDSQNEQIVQEALEHAQIEDPSRTSLIIAHRLSTIRSCDSIYVVNKGKLIESGTHTELIQ
ncbi:unnamed protein product [Rotaria socialis]